MFGSTLTHQNLLFCRVPINSIIGFTLGTYKKVGFGRLRLRHCCDWDMTLAGTMCFSIGIEVDILGLEARCWVGC